MLNESTYIATNTTKIKIFCSKCIDIIIENTVLLDVIMYMIFIDPQTDLGYLYQKNTSLLLTYNTGQKAWCLADL